MAVLRTQRCQSLPSGHRVVVKENSMTYGLQLKMDFWWRAGTSLCGDATQGCWDFRKGVGGSSMECGVGDPGVG